jgi:16S rRNA (guanine527-N7)-methyltransferase
VLFGPHLHLATRYTELLLTAGIERGLIGPREGTRIWERHLLNSAVIAKLIPDGARLIDVGSGAGLPGIPVALARPTSQVLLLEPMARRCGFLEDVVEELGLGARVTVMRGRAPDDSARLPFFADYALARAVAPLRRLVSWTMPVVRPGGELLAMRGQHAKQELQEAGPGLAQPRAAAPAVVEVGTDLLGAPVRVVRVQRSAMERRSGTRGSGRRGSRGSQRFT